MFDVLYICWILITIVIVGFSLCIWENKAIFSIDLALSNEVKRNLP